jgi:hypothetical protein
MINAMQLRTEIIRPVLEYLDPVMPYSMAAENLLMGTAAQESRLGSYIKQVGNGPALGIFQMEPATENDIVDNYLEFRGELHTYVFELTNEHDHLPELTGNLYYACAMARVHYYRQPGALPDEDNVAQMANYWKLFYNTPEGRGTEAEFIHNYNKYVA